MASIIRQLLYGIEDERKCLGRSLHDGVAQSLSRIIIRLERMGKAFGARSRAFRDNVFAIARALALATAAVHRQAKTLWSSMLDDLGLVPSLASYLDGFSVDFGIRTSFRPERTAERLGGEQRMAMFRTVQDACIDAARRSSTRSISVSIRSSRRDLCLEISGDGSQRSSGRLSVMRERLRLAGGRLRLCGTAGRAGSIIAMIPLRLLGPAADEHRIAKA